jgi:hypothetical protein
MAFGVSRNPPSCFSVVVFFRSCLAGLRLVFCIRTERCYIAAPFIVYIVFCVALEPCGVAKRTC